jgi:hypothetical protein
VPLTGTLDALERTLTARQKRQSIVEQNLTKLSHFIVGKSRLSGIATKLRHVIHAGTGQKPASEGK